MSIESLPLVTIENSHGTNKREVIEIHVHVFGK